MTRISNNLITTHTSNPQAPVNISRSSIQNRTDTCSRVLHNSHHSLGISNLLKAGIVLLSCAALTVAAETTQAESETEERSKRSSNAALWLFAILIVAFGNVAAAPLRH